MPELQMNEWVRANWPACIQSGPDGLGPSESGTLVLTNRRLIFVARTPLDTFSASFDELTTVESARRGLRLNMLVVETARGGRIVFKTKKMACKQIVARSQMRLVTRPRSLGPRPLDDAARSTSLQPPSLQHFG
jgi:hypothetical protein